jgi:hypothetical protein
MLALYVELTRAQEVVAAAEATHVAAVLAAETSTQEATMARDSAAVHVRDAEDWAALAKREAQERVLRVRAKNTAALASTREYAEGLAQKVALLKGELAEVRRAREVAKENFCGLSDAAAGGVREGVTP